MSSTPAILTDFPHTRFIPDARLITWHPQGVLDDQLAERIVDFMEAEEFFADAPFNRYTDLSGITEVHLKIAHAFRMTERRRQGYSGMPVKSAFFAGWIAAFGMARLYEELMFGALIEVRVFRTREAAAKWLQVSPELLNPTP